MRSSEVLDTLREMGDESLRSGMARLGIDTTHALGIRIPALRHLARLIGRNHPLSLDLWTTGIHEARLLAVFLADPAQLTEATLQNWAGDFSSWDLCDQACGLFAKTPFARRKVNEWTSRPEVYVRRAGFSLIATLAVHDKKAPDDLFLSYLPLIAEGAGDHRNFVKKAVSWALRQTGKRNAGLHAAAVQAALTLRTSETASARWVGNDALRELTSDRQLAWMVRK